DMWDEEDGINNLHASVKITAEQSPLDPPPTPPFSDAIVLPGTLNKANVDAFSSDMTWYNTDYFDFGPDDASNLDRWAEWKVELKYPGKYFISEEMASVLVSWGYLCHSWSLQLLDNDSPVSTYNAEEKCDIDGAYAYDTPWDLSAVPTGTYTLHVQNTTEWAQPKLKSLTLAYDGEIPTATEQITNPKSEIVHIDGTLYILRNGHMYTLNGQMIK
ncbi:MAG: hypothetical protein J5612_04725, partial [Paludibacteraceae bacterium]|nr:hypothetical protein [Paludibacteraceae bacterium]